MGLTLRRVAPLPRTALATVDHASRRQRGAGLFGMVAGFTVFMLLLVAAVQVLFNLYATTVVTGAALDAARQVAGYDNVTDRCAATRVAEGAFLRRLGDYSRRGAATLAWTCSDPEVVRVTVRAQHPTILPAGLAGLAGLGRLQRTVEVRVEDMR